MRYAGHTSNVCGILGQLKSFKTLDTNRLAPLYMSVCVCGCSCLPVGVRLDGHISLADILMQIAFLIFLVFLFSIEPQEKTKGKYGNSRKRKTHTEFESKRKLHNFFNKYLIQVLNYCRNNLNCQKLLLFRLFYEL